MTSKDLVILDADATQQDMVEDDVELGITKANIIKQLEKQGFGDVKLERKRDYSKMNYKEKYYFKTLRENIESCELSQKRLKEKIKVYEYELELINKLKKDSITSAMENKIYTYMNRDKAELKLYNKWLMGYKRIQKYLNKQYEKNTE